MADGVRRIARALHKRAGEEEKREAKEFFRKIDSNGDGRINLGEFKKGVEHRLSSERVFRQLDSKGDGGLSFDDALVLFYYSKKAITIPQCCGCDELIFGPSFCCFECLFESHDRWFTVCCDCYGKGKFRHPHPLSPIDLLQDKSLLDQCRQRLAEAEAKKEMEKLSNIAKSHYRAASPEVKAMADDFFKSMDTDGDRGVDLEGFLTFVRENGYTHMHNNHFFKKLDTKGKGSLDFGETMTPYSIIKSGRPFCNCCAEFIPGIYFSCVVCFENPKTSYNICYTCYRSERCRHSHKGSRALFLDNYTLLQATQEPATGKNYGPRQISDASKPPKGARVAGGSVEQQPKRNSALKTRNDSDHVTEYMINKLNEVVSESQATAIVARNISTPLTYQSQHVNPHSHKHNGESSSQSLRQSLSQSISQSSSQSLRQSLSQSISQSSSQSLHQSLSQSISQSSSQSLRQSLSQSISQSSSQSLRQSLSQSISQSSSQSLRQSLSQSISQSSSQSLRQSLSQSISQSSSQSLRQSLSQSISQSSSQSLRRQQGQSSSQEITPVKMAVATFKVLEAAVTIASLSATCTIL